MSNVKSRNFNYTSWENRLEILATKIIDNSISKELKFRKNKIEKPHIDKFLRI